MTDLVRFIFSIGGLSCAVLAGSIWTVAHPKSARPRRFLLLVAISYVAVSIYPLSHAAARLWTTGYRPFAASDVPAGPTAIVVLGSGSFTAQDWDASSFSIPDPHAANRVAEAARVYRMTDAEWVISSGGHYPRDRHAPSGATMHAALIELGVPASRILVETESETTRGEAVIVAGMLKRLNVEHVILVTTGLHMRRSIGAFLAEGIETIPAIARGSDRSSPWEVTILPSEAGLDEAGNVAHEILGLGYYAIRGWSRWQ